MSSGIADKKDGPNVKDDLNNAEKIVVLLLKARESDGVPGNLWLQKETFLVAQELGLDGLKQYLGYEPHFQGPFSETVNNISENLQYMGIAKRDRRGIRLTEMGEEVAEDIWKGSNRTVTQQIEHVKQLLNDLSKDELLVYIYYTFPEMTTQSLEKEDLEPKRKSVAKHLYERGKVDKSKAEKLAGESL